MPKHLPAFKHLLSSSNSNQRSSGKPEKSVNQLIAASRSGEHQTGGRDLPPHPHVAVGPSSVSRGSPRVVPDADELLVMVACGMSGEAPVHPAELLRRSELARRQAARSVAGPVPPPSWRANAVASSSKPQSTSTASSAPSCSAVTKGDLIAAQAMFERTPTQSPGLGSSRLVEHCLTAVLRHLESTEVIYEEVGEGTKAGTESRGMTIGEAMREQVGYLEPHLKIALLDLASIRPESSGPRLSDRSIRAIVHRPTFEWDEPDGMEEQISGAISDPEDWADSTSAPPDLHYLPLVLQPNPLPILRELSSFPALSLSSLNLAYSTIKELEKLVGVLPAGLRELGMVGIRLAGSEGKASEDDPWRRGLAAMGRRMIVLRVLDLSFPSMPILPAALSGLIHPGNARLPSLVALGLRGVIPQAGSTADTVGLAFSYRTILSSLRSPQRKRWVEVILE